MKLLFVCLVFTLFLETSNATLLSLLEKALINDSRNLQALQSAFYPAKTASPSIVSTFIEDCAFVIKKIHNVSEDDPAFSNCSLVCDVNGKYYCFTPRSDSSNIVYLSNGGLLHFIYSANIQDILMVVDYVSFKLFDLLTHLELQPFESDGQNYALIFLTIDEIDTMPSQEEVRHSLELLLSWGKYYARSYGRLTVPKEESDQMMVVDLPEDDEVLNWISLIGLYLVLNIIITIVSVYCAPTILCMASRSDSLTRREVFSLFWAVVIVCGVLNVSCILVYFIEIDRDLFLEISFGPMIVIFLIEVISVWIVVKDFRMIDSFCCFSNRYLLRAVHTLAVCHILWFLHRVGCGLMVSLFFLALVPAQTLAAIAVIFSVVVFTILYVAFSIHNFTPLKCCTKQCCKFACKYFVAFVVYLGLIGSSFFLLIIFVQLFKYSFASSILWNVVISFIILAFFVAAIFLIKRRLEKYYKPDEEQPGTLDGGQNSEVQVSEKTPLIAS